MIPIQRYGLQASLRFLYPLKTLAPPCQAVSGTAEDEKLSPFSRGALDTSLPFPHEE